MFSLVLAFFLVAVANAQPGPKMVDETTRWSQCKDVNQSIYDFQMETLQGQFTDLSQYKGQVLLIINVATFCGEEFILCFLGLGSNWETSERSRLYGSTDFPRPYEESTVFRNISPRPTNSRLAVLTSTQ
ncbi:hypothetical protein COOONC_07375 [Cooperia oncophora]